MWRLFITSLLVVVVGLTVEAEPSYQLSRSERNLGGRNEPTFGVTNSDLKKTLDKVFRILNKDIKGLVNNLFLHESREKQVADFSTKTLNSLNSDHAQTERVIQGLARQLVKMEERIMSVEELIKTNEDRQRNMLSEILLGINSMLSRGPAPPEPAFPISIPSNGAPSGEQMQKVINKINNVDTNLQKGIREMNNEVKIVGETLQMFTEMVNQRNERLEANVNRNIDNLSNDFASVSDQVINLSSSLFSEIVKTNDFLEDGHKCDGVNNEVLTKLEKLDQHYQDDDRMNNEVLTKLDKLDQLYHDQDNHIKTLSQSSNKAFMSQENKLDHLESMTQTENSVINGNFSDVLKDLGRITSASQKQLETLTENVKSAINESTRLLTGDLSKVGETLKAGNGNIMDALDDTGSQVENLQRIISENHDDMHDGIKGLNALERVMINTADSVLETKKSIEFGIQQVILELGDIVQVSGSTINTTLSDQIKNISFDIIKNQTTALTNMTTRVEKEISQVWRQIGIMYSQMSQTVDLLDDLQNTTKTHMNATLNNVGSMDGTVGKISHKVAGVEDNLNFLLGRLSLVVSEFNHMKDGVGNELEKMRSLAGGIDTKVDADPIPFKINQRRHAVYKRPIPIEKPKYSPRVVQPNPNSYSAYYGQVLPRHPQMPEQDKLARRILGNEKSG